MTETSATLQFPRRDANGRVVRLAEMLAASVMGVLLGLAGLVLVDGVVALLGLARFGSASGWLALILPALLFFDDLRAWRGYGLRFLVALVAAVVAIMAGLVVAGAAGGLPPMLSGAIGAAVACPVYAALWFGGMRWLAGDGVEVR